MRCKSWDSTSIQNNPDMNHAIVTLAMIYSTWQHSEELYGLPHKRSRQIGL